MGLIYRSLDKKQGKQRDEVEFYQMAYLFIEISRSVLITIYFDVIAFLNDGN